MSGKSLRGRALAAVPLVVGVSLVVAACGSSSTTQTVAQQPAPAVASPELAAQQETTAKLIDAVAAYLDAQARSSKRDPEIDKVADQVLAKAVQDARAVRSDKSKPKDVGKISTGVVPTSSVKENETQAGRASGGPRRRAARSTTVAASWDGG